MEQQHGLNYCGVKHCKGIDCKGGKKNDSYERAWSRLEEEKDLIKQRRNLLESEKEFLLEKQIADSRAYAKMKELADKRSDEALKADERMAAKKLKKRNTPKARGPEKTFEDHVANSMAWAILAPTALNIAIGIGATALGLSTAPVLVFLIASTPAAMLGFAIFGLLRSVFLKPKKRRKRKSRRG